MIVRKELADNFCLYAPTYTDLSTALSWARTTLDIHRNDRRDYVYTRDQWESALTHDPAWNAAQRQLTRTGKIHGYMRMYWAKKILEWSATPEQALATCIYLNDHYSIDGGDPNGYVGILWSVAGLHDRPWTERTVFGKIRYMNYGGLQRKFDINTYIETWA
jgi:deoxyribodipyrimidine photo-lyase